MTLRLPPPDRADLPVDAAELLTLVDGDGRAPATIELLAHSSSLLGPFLGWAAALARAGSLSPHDHEVLALRISYLCESPFEWHEHRAFARAAGLTDAEIDAIARYPAPDDALGETDRALLAAVDELHAGARVSEATYDTLASHYRPEQLVEIPMVVGQYAMLSMLTGFVDLPAPDTGPAAVATEPASG
jgi:alkylhydroperoxidase family enzyme